MAGGTAFTFATLQALALPPVAGVRQSGSVGPVRMPFKPVAHPLRGHVVQLARRDAEVSADQFREYCATPVVKTSYEVAVLPSADETVGDAGGSQGARLAHPAPERALLGIDDLTASHRNGRPHAIREVRVSPRDLRAGSLGRHDPALAPANMCPPFALRMSESRRSISSHLEQLDRFPIVREGRCQHVPRGHRLVDLHDSSSAGAATVNRLTTSTPKGSGRPADPAFIIFLPKFM